MSATAPPPPNLIIYIAREIRKPKGTLSSIIQHLSTPCRKDTVQSLFRMVYQQWHTWDLCRGAAGQTRMQPVLLFKALFKVP